MIVFPGNDPFPQDTLLQKIAAEFNYAETAYVRKHESSSPNDFELRWFTPEREVPYFSPAQSNRIDNVKTLRTCHSCICVRSTKSPGYTFGTIDREHHFPHPLFRAIDSRYQFGRWDHVDGFPCRSTVLVRNAGDTRTTCRAAWTIDGEDSPCPDVKETRVRCHRTRSVRRDLFCKS